MRFENKVAIGRVLLATVAAQIVFARGQKAVGASCFCV